MAPPEKKLISNKPDFLLDKKTLITFALGAGVMLLCVRFISPAASTSSSATIPKIADEQALVSLILREELADRHFSFAQVATASSGKRVIPLDDRDSHRRVLRAIESAMEGSLTFINQADSPIHELRRINEASLLFENQLIQRLQASDGMQCEVPKTREGEMQRAGYPDIKITDTQSGDVFYLDPKLMERGSEENTLRTFYFEPKQRSLKILDDAVHLLVGIEHDGNDGNWSFTGWRLVDLSRLRVRMKAEFQAANADLYQDSQFQPNQAR
ncbi:MAG: hypothetical protein EAZ42_11325 [Verrucomicrobia bacterium]|nr:MAG: hypothetical protein EAZ42_11325 [Verrucomicrobiota bacterium]